MRALTISQPWASIIATGDKFVENRTWATPYRGALLIHAGKGTQYLTKQELAKHPTGCILAVCRLLECVEVATLCNRIHRNHPYPNLTMSRMLEVSQHEYTEGPFAFVLSELQTFTDPIPCGGAQGLWIPSAEIMDAVKRQMKWEIK